MAAVVNVPRVVDSSLGVRPGHHHLSKPRYCEITNPAGNEQRRKKQVFALFCFANVTGTAAYRLQRVLKKVFRVGLTWPEKLFKLLLNKGRRIDEEKRERESDQAPARQGRQPESIRPAERQRANAGRRAWPVAYASAAIEARRHVQPEWQARAL